MPRDDEAKTEAPSLDRRPGQAPDRDPEQASSGGAGAKRRYIRFTRWRRRRFFALLSETGNIAASARAAGFTPKSAWNQRAARPGFALGWDEALLEAEARVEQRCSLICCAGPIRRRSRWEAGRGRHSMSGTRSGTSIGASAWRGGTAAAASPGRERRRGGGVQGAFHLRGNGPGFLLSRFPGRWVFPPSSKSL